MPPLIEINNPALNSPGIIIIDARSGPDSYHRYLTGHLKNAVYADLDKHLAAKVSDAARGGRHPLPDIRAFGKLLGDWGINPKSHVVVYDDKAAANSAARLWWMLNAVGHKKVQVLNGGLKAAANAGVILSTGPFTPTPSGPYPVAAYKGAVDMKETGAAAKSENNLVIDVREAPRYLGQTEPIDLIAGHIPGAINMPYTLNLDADGKFLSPDLLRKIYNDATGGISAENLIVHCGSGVTACHTLLGMAYAGIKGPRLYVGSWSEWSRNDLPIAGENRY